MNSKMVEAWNSKVGQNDIAFHLGDVSASLRNNVDGLKSIVGSLTGRKILIRGNHDHLPDEWYLEAGFSKVFTILRLGDVLLTHYPLHDVIASGRSPEGIETLEFVVHGHSHRTDVPDYEDHFNVAVDRHRFTPIESAHAIPSRIHQKFLEETINLFS
jgi:calcineurin-like phosphoesterase family protein